MKAASPHARLIYAAESLARDTFNSLNLSHDGSCKKTISLQKEFGAFARLALQRFRTLKSDLANWQDQVCCGNVDFASEQEDNFKAALHACVSLMSFLIEKFDHHQQCGLFLTKPRPITLMKSEMKEAEKILHSWQAPEWETTNDRTVKWDKDQSRYLREKLGSRN